MTNNRDFSEAFRKQVVTVTAQRLASDIFNADDYNKPLFETRWKEYQICLNEMERSIAVEAFDIHMKKLGESA